MMDSIYLTYPHQPVGKIEIEQPYIERLEDLMALKRSPDLLINIKIGQDKLRLIMKHILFYGGCSHFGQVT